MKNDASWYRQLFDGFKNRRILVIGDVMTDAYVWGQVDRISPEAPVPVVMVKSRASRLGGAANVALNIKAMGAVPLLCSVVGEDDRGADFMKTLRDEAITCEGIIKSPNRITTTKFRIIGNNVQMLRVDEEVTHPLTQGDENRLLQMINYMLIAEQPDAVIFQDYDKGVLTPGLIKLVIEKAREAGIPVAVDPKKNQFHEYRGVSLFKPNFKELREGMGTNLPKGYSPALTKVAAELQEKMDAEMVMITLSEDGIYFRKRVGSTIEEGHLAAHRRNIADVSGAGDTVISLAALCLASGCSPEQTATISNLAGGIVCEEVGVVPIKAQRLHDELIRLYS